MRQRAWWLGLLLLCASPAFAQPCPPDGQSAESLQALKAAKFAMPDADARRALAMGLVGCLGDPDPHVRDGIAYEALTQWMRAGDFDADALRAMRDALYAGLDAPDDAGFRRPFSALVLSEVARTDRMQPWMTPVERDAMVARAAAYERAVDDYRGYDAREGWRHGVAHGADWLLQLGLNPALERAQLDQILDAVASQVMAGNAHAYVFGEPGRLAQPVLSIAKRGVYSDDDWQRWFAALAAKFNASGENYTDPAWLARRHDLMAFLMSLYLDADRSEDPKIQALEPAIVAALKQVP
jgi:hypothetical protein